MRRILRRGLDNLNQPQLKKKQTSIHLWGPAPKANNAIDQIYHLKSVNDPLFEANSRVDFV